MLHLRNKISPSRIIAGIQGAGCSAQGKLEEKARTNPVPGGEIDRSPVLVDDPLNDAQAQARAGAQRGARLIRLYKFLKNPLANGFGRPSAVGTRRLASPSTSSAVGRSFDSAL